MHFTTLLQEIKSLKFVFNVHPYICWSARLVSSSWLLSASWKMRKSANNCVPLPARYSVSRKMWFEVLMLLCVWHHYNNCSRFVQTVVVFLQMTQQFEFTCKAWNRSPRLHIAFYIQRSVVSYRLWTITDKGQWFMRILRPVYITKRGDSEWPNSRIS